MDAFTRDGVVKDVLDSTPPSCLGVRYDDIQLQPGGQLTPTQVKSCPQIEYEAQAGDMFTLILSDPDAPSRAEPQFKEILHWLVVNISGSDISSGEEKVQYIGSGAPKGTGLHRYVFQLYKQPKGKINYGEIEAVSNTSANGRRSFNSKEFASKHGLHLIAGNFFNAEWDEYVPTLHAQLGFKPPTSP